MGSACLSKEAVEDKNETNQPNGTPHNSENIYPQPNGSTDSGVHTAGPHDVRVRLQGEPHRTTITTQADLTPRPLSNTITSGTAGVPGSPKGRPITINHSTDRHSMTEPGHVRVMFPVEGQDKHIPVIHHRAIQIPVSHEITDSPLPQDRAEISFMHSTPLIKTTLSVANADEASTPVGCYEEVPSREPDLTLRPKRSALKGAKKQEELQIQLQRQLQARQQYASHGDTPKIRPQVAPKPKSVRLTPSFMPDGHNKENQPHNSYDDNIPDYDNLQNSDSDEDIHYRDETGLAAKVQRQDSLARLLSNRPNKEDLINRNILHTRSNNEITESRGLIGSRLTRRLSLRPTAEDLENRNILHRQNLDELARERDEKKKVPTATLR